MEPVIPPCEPLLDRDELERDELERAERRGEWPRENDTHHRHAKI